MKHWLLLMMAVFATTWFVAASPLRAQSNDADVIEQGRDALQRRGSMPWYDAETDDLRALNLPPQKSADFDNRKSRWEDTSTPSTNTTTNLPTFDWMAAFWNVMLVIFWILIIAILALVIYFLVVAFIGRENSTAVVSFKSQSEEEDDKERIESLPFVVARPRGDLLDEARAQYQSGNFRLAVIYLFSYLLIHLDKHHQIRLAKGKTNRQYLGELRPQPGIRSIVEQTMYSFEDVFFGDHTLTREEFEACWNQLDQFHRQVQEVAV